MRVLTAVILLTVNVQYISLTSFAKSKHDVSSIFEGLGYSPVCVASALASCERFAKPDCYLHVLYLLPELKTLLQGIKCESKPTLLPEDTFRNLEVVRKEENSVSSEIVRNLTDLFARQVAAINEASKINISDKDEIKNAISDLKEIKSVLSDLKTEKVVEWLGMMSNITFFRDDRLINDSMKGKDNLINKYDFESSHSSTSIGINNHAKNCADVSKSCLATVYPFVGMEDKPLVVPCVDTHEGGKWTVIQNRDIAVTRQNFIRPWSDYVKGFGDLSGEFWLGLDNILALTNITKMELTVELEDFEGARKWPKYDFFKIGDASTKYALTLGKYSGDAGDSLSYHNGMKFTTYDQDNDEDTGRNCALTFKGAWWYKACHSSNLNGYQYIGKHSSFADGINWKEFRGYNYSLKKASMKIRPVT